MIASSIELNMFGAKMRKFELHPLLLFAKLSSFGSID